MAFEALRGHEEELSTLPTVLENLRWGWLLPAAIVEAASYVAFAGVQYRLLGAGGLRPPVRPLIAITFGGQSINNSLPGGPALAAVYAFRWFRRFGADDTLAGWAIVGTGITAAVTLALVAAGGLAMATAEGATLDLVPVVIGVLLVALAIGAVFVYERPMVVLVGLWVRVSKRLFGRPRRDQEAAIAAVMRRVTAVRLGWRDVLEILGWGTSNWLLDCACFAFAFLAIGAPIPWRGLLLAYGAGQLAANLPITPGGLGVVEGSITIALVAFDGAKVSTVDAVVLYRLLSFWAALIVGWVLAGVM
ncbi:MAG TPA: lysylphosphatidylglycerol synthase transmembrane domain-containing protein, partial [Acidimicrobiales bacterium]|nr:lysylphosphatidylglycerol synthase transmembrane domain-containing protein [Acidimicrobiales bacterium]